MSESVVGLLLVSACGFGLVAGWLITRKEFEIKLLEAERDFGAKLDKAIRRNIDILKEHNALLEKIRDMSRSSAKPDDFNKLWQEVRQKLQSH